MTNIIMKKFLTLSFLLAFVAMGCSDDDDYNSTLPTFSDIEFSEETIYTDQEITATAIQSSKGKLLDATTYSWTGSWSDELVSYSSVVYDDNNGNPSCTFTTPSYAGTFTIQLYAKYRVSGQASYTEGTTTFDDGSASYALSSLTGTATVKKSFKVVSR